MRRRGRSRYGRWRWGFGLRQRGGRHRRCLLRFGRHREDRRRCGLRRRGISACCCTGARIGSCTGCCMGAGGPSTWSMAAPAVPQKPSTAQNRTRARYGAPRAAGIRSLLFSRPLRLSLCGDRGRGKADRDHPPPTSLGSGRSREAVGAPALAADPVMNEEEAIGIVLVLQREQPRVVRTPEGFAAIPGRRNCPPTHRSRLRHQLPHLVHGPFDRVPHPRARPRGRARGRGCRDRPAAPAAPLIASAKASSTAGFVAVSRAAAIASAGAPARPLLTCSVDAPVPDAANRASARCSPTLALSERGGKPRRLVAVQELPGLAQVARPEHIGLGRARPVVGQHEAGRLPRARRGPRSAAPAAPAIFGGETTLKSCGEPASQSRNGRQTACAWPGRQALEHHRDRRGCCPAGRRSARPSAG